MNERHSPDQTCLVSTDAALSRALAVVAGATETSRAISKMAVPTWSAGKWNRLRQEQRPPQHRRMP